MYARAGGWCWDIIVDEERGEGASFCLEIMWRKLNYHYETKQTKPNKNQQLSLLFYFSVLVKFCNSEI